MRAFEPLYNPELAIRVLARVREVVPDASLVMAGQDKGLEHEVRRICQVRSLQEAVRFAGFLDMEGKAREGNAADVFLNTNHVDNMPVSVVEACAMGLPVVATAVGGLQDLLTHGETGLLVPDDNDQEMAAAVLQLLDNRDLAAKLSANGRRLAEGSARDQVRPLWETLLGEMMTVSSGARTEAA
jgi:glycosyltransferase involved in cell wall biosynthesis